MILTQPQHCFRPDENKDKVLVKLYMESQCPACRRFSTTYLKDIVEAPGMSDIVDLEYVPFGYGKVLRSSESPSWSNCFFVVKQQSCRPRYTHHLQAMRPI
jgi:hypothetical protein